MYFVFTVSQFHADAHSVYLVFQIAYMFLFDTTIISESMNVSLSLQQLSSWRVLSVLAVTL